MPPGRAETRHHHTTARQVFFCLSGALEIELDGVDHHLTLGEALPVPAKAVHQVRNPGAEAAEFLVISAPSTRADRIESAG
nr:MULTISPECIES: cupin domain-containing protein [unclassified Roseobacter]